MGGWLNFWLSSINFLLFFFETRSSPYNFSPTLSLINMFKEKRFRVSIRQCRVLLHESGGKGDKKKSGSMNFCPNLFRQNLIVKKKERKKENDEFALGPQAQRTGLRCYPSILLSGFSKKMTIIQFPASETEHTSLISFN